MRGFRHTRAVYMDRRFRVFNPPPPNNYIDYLLIIYFYFFSIFSSVLLGTKVFNWFKKLGNEQKNDKKWSSNSLSTTSPSSEKILSTLWHFTPLLSDVFKILQPWVHILAMPLAWFLVFMSGDCYTLSPCQIRHCLYWVFCATGYCTDTYVYKFECTPVALW